MSFRTWIFGLALTPALAFAGGTATLTAHDNQGRQVNATVEYAGASRMRLASPSQPNAYVIVRDGKIFHVANVQGRTVVMEARDFMRMAGNLMPSPTAAIEEISAITSLISTGRKETVAGIAGTVYQLAYEDGKRQRRTEELVLAPDARAREFTQATVALGRSLAAASGTIMPQGADDLVKRINGDGLGLLRFGTRITLNTINDRTPAEARFALPQGSFQVPDLGGLFPGLGGR